MTTIFSLVDFSRQLGLGVGYGRPILESDKTELFRQLDEIKESIYELMREAERLGAYEAVRDEVCGCRREGLFKQLDNLMGVKS